MALIGGLFKFFIGGKEIVSMGTVKIKVLVMICDKKNPQGITSADIVFFNNPVFLYDETTPNGYLGSPPLCHVTLNRNGNCIYADLEMTYFDYENTKNMKPVARLIKDKDEYDMVSICLENEHCDPRIPSIGFYVLSKCECGSEKANIPGHSTWCPKFTNS